MTQIKLLLTPKVENMEFITDPIWIITDPQISKYEIHYWPPLNYYWPHLSFITDPLLTPITDPKGGQ